MGADHFNIAIGITYEDFQSVHNQVDSYKIIKSQIIDILHKSVYYLFSLSLSLYNWHLVFIPCSVRKET